MKCEKCGRDHDGNYGSGRFCSTKCARSRVQTEEVNSKRAKSNKIASKLKWGNDNYREKQIACMKSGKSKPGWLKKAGEKGREIQKNKKEEQYKQYISEGKYELLSRKYRRKILFKEVDYKCECCKNSE